MTYDEIPATLGALMGHPTTLEYRGAQNVIAFFDENHFKRMGTLIASLAVVEKDGQHTASHIKPAIILKARAGKVIANPNNILLSCNDTGFINPLYVSDLAPFYLKMKRDQVLIILFLF